MRTKDTSVQCIFHPALTAFLFGIDLLYREWGEELVITSGSEPTAVHSYTSLHYATPCQAADIRSWIIHRSDHRGTIDAVYQAEAIRAAANIYCDELGIPHNWIDVIIEEDHIHIEYQPKRIEGTI